MSAFQPFGTLAAQVRFRPIADISLIGHTCAALRRRPAMKLSLVRVAFALSALSVASPALSGQGSSAAPTRPAPVMMERMTTAEVRDAIKGGKTTVLIFNA